MTNKISKAQEALEEILNTCDWPQSIIPEMSGYVRTIENIFDTLSSIDAERLGEDVAHVKNLDKAMRRESVYPSIYSMSVPVDEQRDSDFRIKRVCEAAAMLHGLVGGEE